MAIAVQIPAQITMEKYLQTTYSPDCEYIDGEIKERHDAPLLIIEIMSPEDTYADTQQRASDYQTMGVQNIWIIDPETRSARIISGDSWQADTRLEIPGTPIFVELGYLFARLDGETA